jgi:protease-4
LADTITSNRSASRWFWGIFLSLVFIGLILLSASFFTLAKVIGSSGKDDYYSKGRGDKIALVEINDVIMTSQNKVQEIKKYREDKSIKAIVLRVDSPGGGVAASQEIYEEVRKTRDAGKPVIVSMGSVAASGGYYISCGANIIVANPGTVTGSIGVIANFISFKDLADKIGIKENTVKSGKLKDAGNPLIDMNDTVRAYFQDLINNTFDQFLEVVSRERKIDRNKLLEYADGRVFTGVQAKEIGLIDSLGTLEDAIRIAANTAGIEDEPRIIKTRKKESIFELFLGTKIDELKDLKTKLFEEPILQYKFNP